MLENATDKVNDMMKQLVPMTGFFFYFISVFFFQNFWFFFFFFSFLIGAFSFGTVSGFCSGFALKKLGKAAAATFGVVFMGFQVLFHFFFPTSPLLLWFLYWVCLEIKLDLLNSCMTQS